jgi:hypothetical protein
MTLWKLKKSAKVLMARSRRRKQHWTASMDWYRDNDSCISNLKFT